ncbi:hypothetical protein EFR00_30275 [Rhizobium sophoriradicis]|uniref:hypothetical protein n=1 Tax=Rhizobium sophoriradicis TaxID=1535245 RepID=UPI00098F4169|nr:hypothetical protein [Rhizobium sophoriradicis]RSB82437.1 hypothetical protein EFR00_30275 [Rhizobium sophoriradicis]
MFYALRRRAGSDRQTLVEFQKKADMAASSVSADNTFSVVRADVAHAWVRQGNEHETGLFLKNGKLRYAAADKVARNL